MRPDLADIIELVCPIEVSGLVNRREMLTNRSEGLSTRSEGSDVGRERLSPTRALLINLWGWAAPGPGNPFALDLL